MKGGPSMARMPTTSGPHATLYSLVCLLVLSVGAALGAAGDTPRRGGTLRWVALALETLDPHLRTLQVTYILANHFLEGLYTTGLDGGPIPMLAEGHTISDDGLRYTFNLRRGVPFHHGKELTAGDVVPSLQRWGRKRPWGR